jgi:hypothetical protein
MKVTLKVSERIWLLGFLPKEGDLITQRIVHALREKLGISDEDFKLYDIKQVPEMPGAIKWDTLKDVGVEYEFGDKTVEIISQSLLEVDKQKKVTEDFLILFDKFIPADKVSL